MRTAFIRDLLRIARDDKRVHLIVGDLGFSVIEEFARQRPDQFLNAGVAEQNMSGMAAGLVKVDDNIVFTYSIGNFPILRCLEQIRNDICLNNSSVKIVAVGGGVSYGNLGYTHYAVEDISIMRSLPNMVVAVPADSAEAEGITRMAYERPGPWFIRLGKTGEPAVHGKTPLTMEFGKALEVAAGDRGTILSTGPITHEALLAVRHFAGQGVRIRLLSMAFVKPLDQEAIRKAARETPWILTLEEHFETGGLGSAVAEVLAPLGNHAPLHRLFLPGSSLHDVGCQAYIRKRSGLDAEGVIGYVGSKLLK
jgi:transketolase